MKRLYRVISILLVLCLVMPLLVSAEGFVFEADSVGAVYEDASGGFVLEEESLGSVVNRKVI